MVKYSEKYNVLAIRANEKLNVKTSLKTDKHILTIGNNNDGKLFIEYMNKQFTMKELYDALQKVKK